MPAELRLDGKVALVTGAGRGMGRTHALALAARGAKLVVNDLGGSMAGEGSSVAPAETVCSEIHRAGGVAVVDTNDVSSEDGAKAMVRAAIDNFGRLDIVIHNAGVVTFVPFSQMTYAEYRKLVSVHQDGAFLVAKAAWPYMVSQSYGRFVFISSLASLAGLTHYASAKAALTGFVRSLAAEGEPHNIRANALSVIAYTRLMAAFFDPQSSHADIGLHGQDAMEHWWRNHLRPEQVSEVVAWLAHEVCDLSGQTLFTGGGYVSLQFIGLTKGHADVDLTAEEVHRRREQIIDAEAGFNMYRASGLESWLFDRIVSGGAPEVPALTSPTVAHQPSVR